MANNVVPKMIIDPQVYPITVDYRLSLAEMVVAGHYHFVNPQITPENFLISGSGQVSVDVVLTYFTKEITDSSVALLEMEKQGFRPATIAELLTFKIKYPAQQKAYPIHALGSFWISQWERRAHACLSRDGSERYLEICWFGSALGAGCRFLAVRK